MHIDVKIHSNAPREAIHCARGPVVASVPDDARVAVGGAVAHDLLLVALRLLVLRQLEQLQVVARVHALGHDAAMHDAHLGRVRVRVRVGVRVRAGVGVGVGVGFGVSVSAGVRVNVRVRGRVPRARCPPAAWASRRPGPPAR